jgi:hypothetical protein
MTVGFIFPHQFESFPRHNNNKPQHIHVQNLLEIGGAPILNITLAYLAFRYWLTNRRVRLTDKCQQYSPRCAIGRISPRPTQQPTWCRSLGKCRTSKGMPWAVFQGIIIWDKSSSTLNKWKPYFLIFFVCKNRTQMGVIKAFFNIIRRSGVSPRHLAIGGNRTKCKFWIEFLLQKVCKYANSRSQVQEMN